MIQAELRIARGKMPAEMAAVPADFVEFAFFLAQRFAGRRSSKVAMKFVTSLLASGKVNRW
jgi:hypothetical protein